MAFAKEFMEWLGAFGVIQFCIFSVIVTYKAINYRRRVKAVKEEEKVALIQPERVFGKPRLSGLLCALIGSTIFNLESMEILSLNPSSGGLGWSIYAVAALAHLLFGFLAGFRTVAMMKSMKAEEPWILVCLHVPTLSYGLFILFNSVRNRVVVWDIAISTGLWVCLSTPAILLGGCTGNAATEYPRDPVVATSPADPVYDIVPGVVIGVASVAYVVAYCGLMRFNCLLGITWNYISMMERSRLLVQIPFLAAASLYLFLGLSHALVIRFNQSPCWWKGFFVAAVPMGIFSLVASFQDDSLGPINALILPVFFMAKFGAFGPLALDFFYRSLFKEQQQQQQMILNLV